MRDFVWSAASIAALGFFFGVRRAPPLWVSLWVGGAASVSVRAPAAGKSQRKTPKRRCSPHSKENPKAAMPPWKDTPRGNGRNAVEKVIQVVAIEAAVLRL